MFIKINSLLILALIFSYSCSSVPDYRKEHNSFMSVANRAKSEMDRKSYKKWLEKRLLEKQSHLQAITGWQAREEKIYGQYEMLESSTASSDAGPSVNAFKARNSAQQMHRYSEQQKFIEKEIFYLNSQLSALESSK